MNIRFTTAESTTDVAKRIKYAASICKSVAIEMDAHDTVQIVDADSVVIATYKETSAQAWLTFGFVFGIFQ